MSLYNKAALLPKIADSPRKCSVSPKWGTPRGSDRPLPSFLRVRSLPCTPLPGRQLSPRADAILFTDEEWTAWVPCKQALWRPSEDDLCAAFKPSASQHRPYECLEKALHVE